MVQRYTLDTNICSFLLKRRSALAETRLREKAPEQIFLSAIVVSELRFGAEKRGSDKLATAIEGWVDNFDLLPWPLEASGYYAQARADLERQGRPIGNMDLLLAAHALAANAVVVTNNRNEFDRVAGLRVEDWSRP